ncbi:MAG: hopanoid biosynthesis associated radical SAM protein HpnJ [Candidatus Rokuibacteriota bacterium]|nr:MAG: hopanoid biosynthesis associated radical SAM protein HpnJ [Candidatus Rokubacteria bacterium]
MFINEWFLPAALVGMRLEPLRHAFGATIACRRDTLLSIGGFEAVADQLADDYMLGWLVSRRGLRVALAPYIVENIVAEPDLRTLFFHELRWTRTFRTVRPLSYFFSLVTYGIPLSLLWLAAMGPSRAVLTALTAHVAMRCGGRVILYRALRRPVPWSSTSLVPIRDIVSFILWGLSFLGNTVRWNDRRFRVGAAGQLARRAGVVGQAALERSTEPVGLRTEQEEPVNATDRPYLRTLFLHPPSYDGFDGGAGARYQARREIRSFWYPTWLAQPAALVPGSRLIDAPPKGLTLDDLRPLAREYELAILHTSTPSFSHDVEVAEALKAENPALRVGFVGAHVAVNPERALSTSEAIEFVARAEFDFTIQEVARGNPLSTILGLSFRDNGKIRHTPDRPVLENMDSLPFVVDVYKRDLVIEHYAIGYLLHPYISLYTGRGCRSKCTFCLWPQTVGGHRYRTRSVEHVASEIAVATRYFPHVREYFFDDDTLTDDLPRVEALARRLAKLGVTWSCNAKANVPYDTLRVLKDNGLRLLLVGYESGNQKILNNVKKGIRLDAARQFTTHAKALGIKLHGTFILGLPGETRETMEETIRFAREIDPDTVQVSIAAPYPGTELYRQALTNGWLTGDVLVDARGAQVSALSYPHLVSSEISHGTEEFYRRFYFRPRKIFAIAKEMIADRRVLRRRLVEGREFLQFLAARRREPQNSRADA